MAAEPPEASGEAARNIAVFQSPSLHSPRSFAARLSYPPPKLYFACAYNTTSYAGKDSEHSYTLSATQNAIFYLIKNSRLSRPRLYTSPG